MKKIIDTKNCFFLLILIFLAININAQKKSIEPDVKIDVKKELDEKGNIKNYDSVYSYFWSGDGTVNIDSLFRSMDTDFGLLPFFNNDDFFGYHSRRPLFIAPDSLNKGAERNDSLYNQIPNEFYNSPYFNDPFKDFFNNSMSFDFDKIFQEQMRMMEELRKSFFEEIPQNKEVPDSLRNIQKNSSPAQSKSDGIFI